MTNEGASRSPFAIHVRLPLAAFAIASYRLALHVGLGKTHAEDPSHSHSGLQVLAVQETKD